MFDWSGGEPIEPVRTIGPRMEMGKNRKTLVVLCCPECAGLDVKCHHRLNAVSYWKCLTCNATWKELARAGSGGKVTPE